MKVFVNGFTSRVAKRSITLLAAVMILGLGAALDVVGNMDAATVGSQRISTSNLFQSQTGMTFPDSFDLPDGPTVLGPGGYFIPMDREPNGQENILRAYGLVYELLRHGVPVRQLIDPAKPSNGSDFVNAGNANMIDLRSGNVVPSRSYRGGAFLVDATAASSYRALPIIAAWQASAGDHTTVHRMVGGTQPVTIARSMYAAPRIAVLKDGNEFIAFVNLNAAGITDSRGSVWTSASPDLLTEAQVAGASSIDHNDGILSHQPGGSPRYSYLVAMHYTTTTAQTPEVVAEIRAWLASSPLTHAFMQCDSARLVENNGLFLTTGGIVDDGNPPTAAPANIAPSNPLSQIDGLFQADTGAVESIGLAGGSSFKPGVTTLINNSGSPLTQRILMMTGRMDGSSSNGNVTYLAGHDYSTTLSDPQSNGVRLMLNTVLGTGATDEYSNGPSNLTLTGPAYSTNRQIPYTLTYRSFNPVVAPTGQPIRLIVTLPNGAAFVPGSASVTPTSVVGNTMTWDSVSPAVGVSESITFTVSVSSDGTFVSRARQNASPQGVVISTTSPDSTTIADSVPPLVSISPSNPVNVNTRFPSFIFSVEPDASPMTVRCRFDSGAYVPCTSPFTSPVALVDGPHILSVVATDSAGNTSDAVFGFTVDTVNDAPAITTIVPTNATEDLQYNYSPAFSDIDGPGATWSLAAAHTCGGMIIPATGAFTFTPLGPAPPAACVVSITVCDGGTPNACSTQTTPVSITAVNDAPTSVAPTTVTAIEDTPLNFTGLSVADGDSAGLNITLSVTNGTLSFGTVSGIVIFNNSGGTIGFTATPAAANAALATVSFTPALNFSGTTSMTFTTSDNVATPVVKTVSIAVSAVNDAPVMSTPGFVTIPNVNYNPGPPVGAVGVLVSSLVDLTVPSGGLDNVSDPDPGALTGIAVTSCSTIKGTCFYSINNGTTWFEISDVTTTSSRLLATDVNTRIFFKPNAMVLGSVPGAFSFKAWDRTTGTNGGTANTTTNGGLTAFSTATANAITGVGGTTLVSIAVTPDNVTIAPGATLQLTATGTFSNGTTQNLTNFATWDAANPQNVSVSDATGSKGRATGNQVTVCCTPVAARLDGISGTARFAVGTPPAITSANAKTFSSGIAGSFTIATTGTYTAAITRTGSLPSGMTFVDNGNGTATISGTPTATGVFPLTFTANANMPPNAVQQFTLTVTTPPLVSLIITPSNSTLNVGGTRQFTATGRYADGSAQDVTDVATWTSSVIGVARISNSSGSRGVATGLSAGTTQIGVQYNGATSSTQLTVTNPIQPTTTTITCPSSVAYAGSARTPCTATVTATGLNQSVAVTYTNNLNTGTATANASYPGASGFAASTASPKTFTITKANPTCAVNGYNLNFDGLPHTAAGSCKGVLNETLSGLNLTGTTHTNSGTYADTWTFAATTNYNSRSGSVTNVIGTLRAAKQAIRAEMNSALSSATNYRDRDKLRDAIDKLDEAIDDDLWKSDGNHLDCRDGSEIFVEVKSVVKKLMAMIEDRGSSNIPDTTIQRWINVLVQVDRRLAQISVLESNMSSQARSKALGHIDEGDDDVTDGDFDKAITHYKRAWNTVRSCNGNDNDDDDYCGHHDH